MQISPSVTQIYREPLIDNKLMGAPTGGIVVLQHTAGTASNNNMYYKNITFTKTMTGQSS